MTEIENGTWFEFARNEAAQAWAIEHAAQIIQQEIVIERQRPGEIGASRERNQTNPIARPFRDELLQDLLRHVQTIDPLPVVVREILRRHARGEIDAQHDVDTARLNLPRALDQPGARQSDNETGEHKPPQPLEQDPNPAAIPIRNPVHERHR